MFLFLFLFSGVEKSELLKLVAPSCDRMALICRCKFGISIWYFYLYLVLGTCIWYLVFFIGICHWYLVLVFCIDVLVLGFDLLQVKMLKKISSL